MIFDLRIYTLHNNKFAAWLKLYEEYGHPTQVKHCGQPVFYATSSGIRRCMLVGLRNSACRSDLCR